MAATGVGRKHQTTSSIEAAPGIGRHPTASRYSCSALVIVGWPGCS